MLDDLLRAVPVMQRAAEAMREVFSQRPAAG